MFQESIIGTKKPQKQRRWPLEDQERKKRIKRKWEPEKVERASSEGETRKMGENKGTCENSKRSALPSEEPKNGNGKK